MLFQIAEKVKNKLSAHCCSSYCINTGVSDINIFCPLSFTFCPPLYFSITRSLPAPTLSIRLFPFNPCSPPNLNHLRCRHFPVPLQFSQTGFIAFFSLSLARCIISVSLCLRPSAQRAVFPRNPILSLFLNPLFHFTSILSH